MDGRVSKNFPRLDDVPHYSSFAEFVRGVRGVVFILSSDFTCYKFSIKQGRREGA